MGKEQTTKQAFPLACLAIRAKRYSIEFDLVKSTRGEHPRWYVRQGKLVVHECSGAGIALKWLNDREASAVKRRNETRLAAKVSAN
jgi:hypothetical protein